MDKKDIAKNTKRELFPEAAGGEEGVDDGGVDDDFAAAPVEAEEALALQAVEGGGAHAEPVAGLFAGVNARGDLPERLRSRRGIKAGEPLAYGRFDQRTELRRQRPLQRLLHEGTDQGAQPLHCRGVCRGR